MQLSDFADLPQTLLWPLLRVLVAMVVGQLIASVLEALHWTRFISAVASPLVRLGHLRDVAGASFSLAFFSPAAANTLLAESYERQELSKRELMLANLFNSSPSFLVHLPSLFTLVYAFIGNAAFIYVGLSLGAAFLRTFCTIIVGRWTLPALEKQCVECVLSDRPQKTAGEVLRTTLKRFRKRIVKLIYFTIPIYCLIYVAHRAGWFEAAETLFSEYFSSTGFLRPETIGIVVLYIAAESGAALSAASSLVHSAALPMPEIVIALMVGNILSSPMRAFRHQLPVYVGYFKPGLAMELIIVSQSARAASLAVVTFLYYLVYF